MEKIIVLDRDGVINVDSKDYVKSVEEWIPIPGSIEAIAALKTAGYKVFVVTNQSGVGRGYYSLETLHAMHNKMLDLLEPYGVGLDGIYYCPHAPDVNCDCRKPKPGMLLQIAKDHMIDLTQCYCVGDSTRDLESARSVGAKAILVLTGNGLQTALSQGDYVPRFADLSTFVKSILND